MSRFSPSCCANLFGRTMLSILCLWLIAGSTFAQIGSYRYSIGSNSARSYQSLASPTIIASGAGMDDQFYPNQQIGFSFVCDNQVYTSFAVSPNGYLILGVAPASATSTTNPMSHDIAAPQTVISALGYDLRGRDNSRIVSQVLGSSPNRTFVIQWQNMGIVNGSILSDTVSAQIILEEQSRTVSISYGALRLAEGSSYDIVVGLNSYPSVFVGSQASVLSVDAPAASLANPWGSATANTNNNSTARLSFGRAEDNSLLQGTPRDGVSYVFEAQSNIGVAAFTGIADGGTLRIPSILSWTPVAGASSYELIFRPANSGGFRQNATLPQLDLTPGNRQAAWIIDQLSQGQGPWTISLQAIVNNGTNEARGPSSNLQQITVFRTPELAGISARSVELGSTSRLTAQFRFTSITTPPTASLVHTYNTSAPAIPLTAIQVVSAQSISFSAAIPANAITGTYNLVLSGTTTSTFPAVLNVLPALPPGNRTGIVTAEIPFRPRVHGWNFANSGADVWPEIYFNRYDYTNTRYPADVRALNPKSSDFPAWDDFVVSYQLGTRQSPFVGSGTSTPTQEALNQWKTSKKAWGGSCAGFAISALMAYNGDYRFTSDLFTTPNTDQWKTLIHRQQISQSYPTFIGSAQDDPNKTVQKIIELWQLPRGKHPWVGIYQIENGQIKGGHALVPYRIVTRTGDNNEIFDDVFVYDMNYPGDTTQRVTVNRTRNTWSYNGFLNADDIAAGAANPWGGTFGFNPIFSADAAVPIPLNPSTSFSRAQLAQAATQDQEQVEVFFEDDEDDANEAAMKAGVISQVKQNLTPTVTIVNADNRTVSNRGDDMLRPSLPGAAVNLPIATGANVDVAGMSLPKQGTNSMRLRFTPSRRQSNNFTGGYLGRFGAFLQWSSTVTTASQDVDINYPNNSMRLIANAAGSNYIATLSKTDPTDSVWMNIITVQNFAMTARDSMDIRLVNDGNSIVITNYGGAKQYDLALERYDTTSFSRIRIGARESQTIAIADWNTINRCQVMVRVDRGIKGKTDSVFFLRRVGTVSSVQPGNAADVFSMQVYPNPVRDVASVGYYLPSSAAVRAEIVNVLGNVVYSVPEQRQAGGKQTLSVPVERFTAGMYYVRLMINNGISTFTASRALQVIR